MVSQDGECRSSLVENPKGVREINPEPWKTKGAWVKTRQSFQVRQSWASVWTTYNSVIYDIFKTCVCDFRKKAKNAGDFSKVVKCCLKLQFFIAFFWNCLISYPHPGPRKWFLLEVFSWRNRGKQEAWLLKKKEIWQVKWERWKMK